MTAHRGRRAGAKVRAREDVPFTPGLAEALVALVTLTALQERGLMAEVSLGDDETRSRSMGIARDALGLAMAKAEPGGFSIAVLVAKALEHVMLVDQRAVITGGDIWDTIIKVAKLGVTHPVEPAQAQQRATQLLIRRMHGSTNARQIEIVGRAFEQLMRTTLPAPKPLDAEPESIAS